MITTIDLSRTHQPKPMISDVLVQAIGDCLAQKKKAYLYLNQRGAGHCLVCRGCGHISRCSECDHVMRVHTHPQPHLECHLCGADIPVPDRCPRCDSSDLVSLGSRIQSVVQDLGALFPDATTTKIELTGQQKEAPDTSHADIIVGTHVSIYMDQQDVGLVGILLVEAELSVPEYDIEERIYSNIMYASRHASDVYLQTYDPDLPIVRDLAQGNFKTFFTRLLHERKKYHYPPYTQMVRIMIEKKTEAQVTKLAHQVFTKLESYVGDDTIVLYDEQSILRYGMLRRQQITLRGPQLSEVLHRIAPDIMRNSGVWLEWK